MKSNSRFAVCCLTLCWVLIFGVTSLAVYYGATPAGDSETARTTVVVIGAKRSLCSGVIIGSHTVLTAAHCVEQSLTTNNPALRVYFPLKFERVNLGLPLNPERIREVTQVLRVESRERLIPLNDKPSPARDALIKTTSDDIAVITIGGLYNNDGGVEDAPTYQPAHVATPTTLFKADQPMRVAGYGMDENRRLGILREGELRYAFRLGIGERPVVVLQTRADAYAPRVCHGDSGGPVFAQPSAQTNVQASNPSAPSNVVVGVLSGILPYSSDPSLQIKLAKGEQLSEHELCRLERVLVMDVRQYGALLRRAAVNDTVLTEALKNWK